MAEELRVSHVAAQRGMTAALESVSAFLIDHGRAAKLTDTNVVRAMDARGVEYSVVQLPDGHDMRLLLAPVLPVEDLRHPHHDGDNELAERVLGKSVSGVNRLLARYDVNTVAALVDGFFEAISTNFPRERTLTDSQREWLVESGAMSAEEVDATEMEIATGGLFKLEMKTQVQTLIDSMSTAEVADRLGIDESRVRHRAAKGLLYSFRIDGRHHFPNWQFASTHGPRLLPGLRKLIEALPVDLDPASVRGIITTPQDDLVIDSNPVSVREWLLSGQSIEEALEVVFEDEEPAGAERDVVPGTGT